MTTSKHPPGRSRIGKRILVTLPDPVITSLDRLARQQHTSRASLIRAALDEWLDPSPEKTQRQIEAETREVLTVLTRKMERHFTDPGTSDLHDLATVWLNRQRCPVQVVQQTPTRVMLSGHIPVTISQSWTFTWTATWTGEGMITYSFTWTLAP